MAEIREYFLDRDYNCAETIARYFNEKKGLNIPEESMKLLSGFGGGMGCERTCGALCGGIAILGALLVKERSHEDPKFAELCGELTKRFESELGTIECGDLKAKYRTEEERCLKTVELAEKVIEEFLESIGK